MDDDRNRDRLGRLTGIVLIALSALTVQGCASIAEGVTRGLSESEEEKPPRPCDVTGPAFQGLSERLRRLELSGSAVVAGNASPQRLKVMMVHGMGTNPPGYSARLQQKLTTALGLSKRDGVIKEIALRAPEYFGDEPLGHLRVFRYMNDTDTQEMLFYELSWSEITAPAKAALAYDTSGEYEYKRAEVNHLLKVFLNDRMADPMAYFGEDHEKILRSVGTGICWMAINDWDDLPPQGAPACDGFQFTNPQEYNEDEFVFVTHSLGSRIVTDAFQEAAESVLEMIDKTSYTSQDRINQLALLDAQRNKEIRVYMLANQLPLLELGGLPPPVVGQMDAYCKHGGDNYDKRFLSELSIIAFSDPNDPLSYALPPNYADEYMDSRLCPEIANVSVNVVDAIDLFGLGEFVNPMAAHSSYEEDDRVIGLMVGGIGFETTDPAVAAECRWLETVDE